MGSQGCTSLVIEARTCVPCVFIKIPFSGGALAFLGAKYFISICLTPETSLNLGAMLQKQPNILSKTS